jgi:hypothetical protein
MLLQPNPDTLHTVIDLPGRDVEQSCQLNRTDRSVGIKQELENFSLAGGKSYHH